MQTHHHQTRMAVGNNLGQFFGRVSVRHERFSMDSRRNDCHQFAGAILRDRPAVSLDARQVQSGAAEKSIGHKIDGRTVKGDLQVGCTLTLQRMCLPATLRTVAVPARDTENHVLLARCVDWVYHQRDSALR